MHRKVIVAHANKGSCRSSANILSRLTSICVFENNEGSCEILLCTQITEGREAEKKKLIKDGYKNNYYGFCLLAEILLFYALVPTLIHCMQESLS